MITKVSITSAALDDEIHDLRMYMLSMAGTHENNLLHPDVLHASVQLDELIVRQMKEKQTIKNRKGREEH